VRKGTASLAGFSKIYEAARASSARGVAYTGPAFSRGQGISIRLEDRRQAKGYGKEKEAFCRGCVERGKRGFTGGVLFAAVENN